MTPFKYFETLTGYTDHELAARVRVTLKLDGSYVVDKWDVPGVDQPTSAQITAALQLPDQVGIPILLAYSDSVQAKLLDAGTTINVATTGPAKNVFVATTTNGLTLLSGAVQFSQINPTATIQWVQNTGIIDLSADDMKSIGEQAYAYVQATFTKKAAIAVKVNNGSITTKEQIDTAYAS